MARTTCCCGMLSLRAGARIIGVLAIFEAIATFVLMGFAIAFAASDLEDDMNVEHQSMLGNTTFTISAFFLGAAGIFRMTFGITTVMAAGSHDPAKPEFAKIIAIVCLVMAVINLSLHGENVPMSIFDVFWYALAVYVLASLERQVENEKADDTSSLPTSLGDEKSAVVVASRSISVRSS